MPFASDYALAASPSHLCGSCRESPPPFDAAVSGGEYGGPYRDLLHTFKFNQRPDLARYIAGLMMETISLPDVEVIMAVPLHPRRLRARGYNQSLLMAREMGRISGIPLSIDDLARVKATRPQFELKHDEREENVRGAFRVTRPAAVEGKRILLIDDVYTTGSTVRECAKVLKKAGAEAVFVATAAMVVL